VRDPAPPALILMFSPVSSSTIKLGILISILRVSLIYIKSMKVIFLTSLIETLRIV
jgi:hypothetical protein